MNTFVVSSHIHQIRTRKINATTLEAAIFEAVRLELAGHEPDAEECREWVEIPKEQSATPAGNGRRNLGTSVK